MRSTAIYASSLFALLGILMAAGDAGAGGSRCGTDPAEDLRGVSWTWRAPGTESCTMTKGQINVSGGISWNGLSLECLEVEGNAWDERWQNLAKHTLQEIAGQVLGNPAAFPAVCSDANAETLMKYIVECALDCGESITFCAQAPGGGIALDGLLGMASDWMSTPLDHIPGGRERVSACIMAHANREGQTVPIRLVTDVLGGGASMGLDMREGAFAGNMFPGPGADGDLLFGLYACEGGDYYPSTSNPGRTCTLTHADPAEDCGFETRACDSVCQLSSTTGDPDAFYDQCNSPMDGEVVTTYLQP